jgi:hypothetical protein
MYRKREIDAVQMEASHVREHFKKGESLEEEFSHRKCRCSLNFPEGSKGIDPNLPNMFFERWISLYKLDAGVKMR